MTEYKKMTTDEYEELLAKMRKEGIFTTTHEPSTTITLAELTKIYNVLIYKELLSEDVIHMVQDKIAECFEIMSENIIKKQIEQSFLGAENLFGSNSEMAKLSETEKRSLELMVDLIEYHFDDIRRVLKKKTIGLDQIYDMMGSLDMVKEYTDNFSAMLEEKEEKLGR